MKLSYTIEDLITETNNSSSLVLVNSNTLISNGVLSATNVLFSSFAIFLMCAFNLYRKLVYRLAAYQVITSVLYVTVWMVFVTLSYLKLPDVVKVFYTVAGSSSFANLMFTFWISFHIASLAIVHRNYTNLEPLYVASSTIVSALVSALGFGVTYGVRSSSSYEILHIVLLGAARSIIVIITLLLVVVMGVIMCCRAYRKKGGALPQCEKQHKKALYELLPLLVYPIFQSVLGIPAYLYGNTAGNQSFNFFILYSYLVQLWCLLAALSLITHICVTRWVKNRKVHNNVYVHGVTDDRTVHQSTEAPRGSSTYYSLQEEN